MLVIPVSDIRGLEQGGVFECGPAPRMIIDKLKSIEGAGEGTVVITESTIRFEGVSAQTGSMSAHTFKTVDDVEDHSEFVNQLKKQSPESIMTVVGAVSLKTMLQAMDTTDSSALERFGWRPFSTKLPTAASRWRSRSRWRRQTGRTTRVRGFV